MTGAVSAVVVGVEGEGNVTFVVEEAIRTPGGISWRMTALDCKRCVRESSSEPAKSLLRRECAGATDEGPGRASGGLDSGAGKRIGKDGRLIRGRPMFSDATIGPSKAGSAVDFFAKAAAREPATLSRPRPFRVRL